MGIWKGTYECNNNPIRVNKGFKAIFNYYPTEEPLDALNGLYYVYWNLSKDGSFTFRSTEWINRPKGHYMVGLQGKHNPKKDTVTGNIKHRGCGKMFLSKEKS